MNAATCNIDRSEVALAIIKYRKDHGLKQTDLAKSLGVTASYVSCLESMSMTHGNIITPAIYASFMQVGYDLKAMVPNLIVAKRRGKDRVFKGDMSVVIRKRNPIDLLRQARDMAKEANALIAEQIAQIEHELEAKRQFIEALETEKKTLVFQQQELLSDMIA